MTKTIEIKIPEPGDKLPFVVAEWEIEGLFFRAGYAFNGNAFVESSRRKGNAYNNECSHTIWAVFAVLGLPLAVKASSAVAEVSE